MLSVNDPRRVQWDLFVMLLAIWNCFQLPLNVAFHPSSENHPASIAIDAIIDVLFLIDIFLNFRTTYFHSKTGEEILDPNEIAIHYLMGRFWADLFASVIPLQLHFTQSLWPN